MTDDPREIERLRDGAIRDLVELERQVGQGEIAPDDAERLRRRYQSEAASALAALERSRRAQSPPGGAPRPSTAARNPAPGSGSRRVLYGAGIVTAALAAVLVSQFVIDRPPGGYVTGNEVLQQSRQSAGSVPEMTSSASRRLSKVSNQDLEAVVAANPQVTGMRLALARRYVAEDRFDLAVVHYTKVLEREPTNAQAQAGLSWILLQLGEVQRANELADQALSNDERLVDAIWVKANVLFYGLRDAKGTLAMLDQIVGEENLPAAVRRQVRQLRVEATEWEIDGR